MRLCLRLTVPPAVMQTAGANSYIFDHELLRLKLPHPEHRQPNSPCGTSRLVSERRKYNHGLILCQSPLHSYNIISVFLVVDPTSNTPVPIVRADIFSGFAGWVTERVTKQFISPESNQPDPRWSLNAKIRRVDRNITFNIFVFFLNWVFAVSMFFLALYCFFVENELPDSIVVLPMTGTSHWPAA